MKTENKIFYDANGGFETQGFRDEMKKLEVKLKKEIFYKLLINEGKGFELMLKRKALKQRTLVWAWVKIANTRKKVWIDTVTNKAYKANGYEKTYIEIKKFTFERWCNGFDF